MRPLCHMVRKGASRPPAHLVVVEAGKALRKVPVGRRERTALHLSVEPWQHAGMGQGFGGETPRAHAQTAHRRPARFLVVIDSGGNAIARLFLETREQVAEFDAATEEATQMAAGLVPTRGAAGPEWDRALEGHSAAERVAAEVYTLAV